MAFLCALLVVSMHIAWPCATRLSLGWFIYQLFSMGFGGIAVPFFFVASGYFFSKHLDENGWWPREVGKRIVSIGVPFAIWSLVWLAVQWAAHGIIPIATNLYSWVSYFGLDFRFNPELGPLWYLRCLFVFVVLGWMFKRVLDVCGVWWLVAVFVAYLFVDCIPDGNLKQVLMSGMTYSGMLVGVLYFSIGIYIRRCKVFPALPSVWRWWGGVFAMIFLVLRVYMVYMDAPQCWIVVIEKCTRFLLLFFIWRIIPAWRIPGMITSCAFPIYLMHMLVVFGIGKALPMTRQSICVALLTYVSAVTIPMLIAILLGRFAPRLSKVVFGGRS